MDEKISPYFECLKLLKDWSTGLVFVQTGAIAVFGGLAQKDSFEPNWMFGGALICFLLSIAFAANVVGVIAYRMQYLPDLVQQYPDNIYRIRNYFRIPLWVLAFLEHAFFVFGITFLGAFLYFGKA